MKLQNILLWILFIISIVLFLWFVFGSSPTFEQTILVLILTLVIANVVKVNVLENRFINLEKSFGRLAYDFKEHTKLK